MCVTKELHVVEYSITIYIGKTNVIKQSQCPKPHQEKIDHTRSLP